MGALAVQDMVEQARDIGTALRWHLQSNHYPPVPDCMVPVAMQAIEHARAGTLDTLIELPAGIRWQGKVQVPAHTVMEDLHLHAFLEVKDEH